MIDGNDRTLAATIASGSRERAKRPRRSSRRNDQSTVQSVSNSPPAADPRKARILATSPPAPALLDGVEEAEPPVRLVEEQAIPESWCRIRHIRALVKCAAHTDLIRGNGAIAAPGAAVVVERRHPDQRRRLMPAQRAQAVKRLVGIGHLDDGFPGRRGLRGSRRRDRAHSQASLTTILSRRRRCAR